MDRLRTKQKKALFEKLSPYVAKRLRWLKEMDQWTFSEISEATGIHFSRITEMSRPDKYKERRPLNDRTLSMLLGGRILDYKDLLEKNNLTPAEQNYLETFILDQDKELRELLVRLVREGKDVKQILREAA